MVHSPGDHAHVLGVDVSETFIKRAQQKSNNKVSYKKVDATSLDELVQLTEHAKFNKVICSMALHDLPVIHPLIQSLPKLLQSDGIFVFSIPHPCFNMGDMLLELMGDHPKVSRSKYIKPEPLKKMWKWMIELKQCHRVEGFPRAEDLWGTIW